jgi:hypothetical protein
MATSAVGNPYVESSDLVANYPATSLALATRLDKYALNPFADATARDAAIPSPVQGQLAQTLDDNKAWKYDGTAWAPFSGAVGAANFTDTATGTYTDAGIDYKYLTVTGTQNVTFDKAGFADVLLIGAGGGGGNDAAGGAGGFLSLTNVYVPLGAQSVTIGAGGVGTASGVQPVIGGATIFRDYYSVGGGGGGWVGEAGVPGASGGGNGRSWSGLVPGIPGLGNSTSGTFGSGGGSGGTGSGGSGNKLGGPGLSSDITGATVFYAGGGNVGLTSTAEARTAANTAGAVNSGSGGGNLAANNGGSGVAIIRVVV